MLLEKILQESEQKKYSIFYTGFCNKIALEVFVQFFILFIEKTIVFFKQLIKGAKTEIFIQKSAR